MSISPPVAVGSGDSNPHWFHIAIFPVTAVNPLKIRQYSLRNLLCYRKNCLCETASTCSAEFLQRISVRKGADGLTPVKTDKAEGFVKIQSTGNAGSSPHCLKRICLCTAADFKHFVNIFRCVAVIPIHPGYALRNYYEIKIPDAQIIYVGD